MDTRVKNISREESLKKKQSQEIDAATRKLVDWLKPRIRARLRQRIKEGLAPK